MRKEEIYLDKLWTFFNAQNDAGFLLSVNEQEEACKILHEFSQESNKELLDALDELRKSSLIYSNRLEQQIQELLSDKEYYTGRISSLSQQLHESQQMNERLVSEKSDLMYALIKAVKTEFSDQNWDYLDFIAERVLQSTTQEKGE